MNQNTKKLLESVGYNYPEQATLAQKLVATLAKEIAAIAVANSEPKTAQAITTKFLTADVVAAPVPPPSVPTSSE